MSNTISICVKYISAALFLSLAISLLISSGFGWILSFYFEKKNVLHVGEFHLPCVNCECGENKAIPRNFFPNILWIGPNIELNEEVGSFGLERLNGKVQQVASESWSSVRGVKNSFFLSQNEGGLMRMIALLDPTYIVCMWY